MPELSRRPYLLRAMLEWIIDCGHTPHAVVDATQAGVQVPRTSIQEGRVILNISPTATQSLVIGADVMEFNARFGGVSHYVRVPLTAVLGIVARETGKGILFADEEGEATGEPGGSPDPDLPPRGPPARKAPVPAKRPSLKVVK